MPADGARFVIRHDHRDTGRPVTHPPGRPGYTVCSTPMASRPHVAGVSAGGALAQWPALDHPARVRSLDLASISPATSGDRVLPPGAREQSW